MKTITYLKYQFHLYILRWRWLLPVAVGLVLGYWASKLLEATLPWGSPDPANALEAFVWAFGKPEIVYYVISMLWIYLIAEAGLRRGTEEPLLLQLRSRRSWWLGKVGFVLLSTLLYAFLLIASFSIPVLARYPLSSEWSLVGQASGGMYLGYTSIDSTPVQACWNILSFLLIGWFAIGLFMLVINLLFKRAWAGFLAGSLLLVCSKLGSITAGPLGGEGLESFFLLQNHLEFTPLWAPVRIIEPIYSWIFWSIWILLCLGVSWIVYKRQNVYAIARREE